MQNKIDLHIHTNKSDGSLTPKEVVYLAKERNLHTISITDHNTVEGFYEASRAGKEYNITVIPGIEFTVSDYGMHTHLLAYYIDTKNIALEEAIKIYNFKKYKSIINFLNTLKKHDIEITKKEIIEKYGRLNYKNIAKEMVIKNVVSNFEEAFYKYIDNLNFTKPVGFKLIETFEIIKKANGISVLAHPLTLSNNLDELKEKIIYLKSHGLDGIECYYGSYSEDLRNKLVKIANEVGLLKTGGSDYHGELEKKRNLGQGLDKFIVPESIIENINLYKKRSVQHVKK